MRLPNRMRAITITDSASLALCEVPMCQYGADDVVIQTAYAGINRADLLQTKGLYPPPDDAPAAICGLEVSGHIAAIGANVTRWRVGDAVCALLSGGGYSEYVRTPASLCLPIPDEISLKEAASLPECLSTVWMTLFSQANVQSGEAVLIHGGSSGIGVASIQMLRAHGCTVFVTAGSREKCEACRELGAQAIPYREQDFVEVVRNAGGVDVILDMVGGDYINRNLKCLKPGGRMVSIACLNGATVELQMGGLLMKGLRWWGATLRARSTSEKAEFIRALEQTVWPWIEDGRYRPVIDTVFPFENAQKAHDRMEKSLHIGKILLQVAP